VTGNSEELELLPRADYSLILMDCQMPEIDGYETTAIIREQEGDRRRIPIVAMTANAMSGDRERCLAVGMDDYISKPIERTRLAEVLRRWVPLVPVAVSAEPASPPAALRRELGALFLEDVPARVAELEAAVRQEDREALRRAAPQLAPRRLWEQPRLPVRRPSSKPRPAPRASRRCPASSQDCTRRSNGCGTGWLPESGPCFALSWPNSSASSAVTAA
jgi:CheY-like chemotaxis protein